MKAMKVTLLHHHRVIHFRTPKKFLWITIVLQLAFLGLVYSTFRSNSQKERKKEYSWSIPLHYFVNFYNTTSTQRSPVPFSMLGEDKSLSLISKRKFSGETLSLHIILQFTNHPVYSFSSLLLMIHSSISKLLK